MTKTFRHSAGFGKRIEYWVIGLMLKEGIDVYVPLVDDDAIDAIIKKSDESFSEEFIKEAVQNKSGKNVGLRSVWFNGKRKDKATGEYKEHVHERFKKYIVSDFSQFK